MVGITHRTTEGLTTLDDHLETEGKREVFQMVAIEEVLAFQIQQTKDLAAIAEAARRAHRHEPQPD